MKTVNVSQDLGSTAGAVIRIKTDGSFPADNFGVKKDGVGGKVRDDIWAYGLRNPFRASWDIPSKRFFIGEVGGNNQAKAFEDIHLGKPGVNFGWPICDTYCSETASQPNECSCKFYDNPIFSYPHGMKSASITGGVVYRLITSYIF
jgi:glucose/arabinose dehydrogenase